jgi:hypothetical protein
VRKIPLWTLGYPNIEQDIKRRKQDKNRRRNLRKRVAKLPGSMYS